MNGSHLKTVLCFAVALVACSQEGEKKAEVEEGVPSTAADSEASSGCGQEAPQPEGSVEVNGQLRTYVLSVPEGYSSETPYPIVFAWHGLGGSGSNARRYFGLEQAAGEAAVIVYPDGLPLESYEGRPGWDLSPNGYDIDFFDSLYLQLTESLCIDTDRVFSTGHSFGGYMSNFVGCNRSEIHSAIAPVAGGGPYGNCASQISAMIVHGTRDDVVLLAEGQSSLAKWAQINECTDGFSSTSSEHCVAYEGCSRDVHWCEHGGVHEWPGFAGETIWAFFAAQ
jgi:polyhydroxybutyrate depolymerase